MSATAMSTTATHTEAAPHGILAWTRAHRIVSRTVSASGRHRTPVLRDQDVSSARRLRCSSDLSLGVVSFASLFRMA
jgi:hypothetical protein